MRCRSCSLPWDGHAVRHDPAATARHAGAGNLSYGALSDSGMRLSELDSELQIRSAAIWQTERWNYLRVVGCLAAWWWCRADSAVGVGPFVRVSIRGSAPGSARLIEIVDPTAEIRDALIVSTTTHQTEAVDRRAGPDHGRLDR